MKKESNVYSSLVKLTATLTVVGIGVLYILGVYILSLPAVNAFPDFIAQHQSGTAGMFDGSIAIAGLGLLIIGLLQFAYQTTYGIKLVKKGKTWNVEKQMVTGNNARIIAAVLIAIGLVFVYLYLDKLVYEISVIIQILA